ncbi:MAG: hypothetical protein ABI481_10505 [Pyrinomonadaceae bacterium]
MRRACICMVLGLILCISAVAQSEKIQGVWKLNEQSTGGGTKVISQPSMYLFTKKHYSIIYVAAETPRAVVDDISKMTADELRATFVSGFIANAGTYEFKGGKLTLHTLVAKSPAFMAAGISATSAVTIKGNSMTMVSESNNSGPVQNPTTSKFTRIE